MRQRRTTDLEHGQHPVPQVFLVPSGHIVNASEERIIDDSESFEKLRVAPELFLKQSSFFRPELKLPVSTDPIEVLEHGSGVLRSLWLGIVSTDRRALCFWLLKVSERRQ
jgi:hypothetical protein